jgi:hypothetical protein
MFALKIDFALKVIFTLKINFTVKINFTLNFWLGDRGIYTDGGWSLVAPPPVIWE